MDNNIRVLPHVCGNSMCRELILPPFNKDYLCKKCRKAENILRECATE